MRLEMRHGKLMVICADCRTPVAEVASLGLVVQSDHHHERHTTFIQTSVVQSLMDGTFVMTVTLDKSPAIAKES